MWPVPDNSNANVAYNMDGHLLYICILLSGNYTFLLENLMVLTCFDVPDKNCQGLQSVSGSIRA